MWVAAYMGSPPGFEPVFPLHMERCVSLHYKDVPINSNIGYSSYYNFIFILAIILFKIRT
jgi:hypothetical protein